MNEMNVQDIAGASLSRVSAELTRTGSVAGATSTFLRVIPDAGQRVAALVRLVEAVEAFEGWQLPLRRFPALAVQTWLEAPHRTPADVAATFRLAIREASHA